MLELEELLDVSWQVHEGQSRSCFVSGQPPVRGAAVEVFDARAGPFSRKVRS